MEGSLVGIAWRILALASVTAGAARGSGSGSSGVGVGRGNSRIAAAETMTTRGLRNRKRIATAVEACGGGKRERHQR